MHLNSREIQRKSIVCNYLFSFPYFFRRISRSDNRKSLMNSEYLFTKLTGKNKGEPLDADSVYSMLKRLSKKTDINSHPHQLRHYFAEERRKEGWDLNDIRFALGHKKVETMCLFWISPILSILLLTDISHICIHFYSFWKWKILKCWSFIRNDF